MRACVPATQGVRSSDETPQNKTYDDKIPTTSGVFINVNGGTHQVYVFKSVQILAHFFTFSLSKGRGPAGTRAP